MASLVTALETAEGNTSVTATVFNALGVSQVLSSLGLNPNGNYSNVNNYNALFDPANNFVPGDQIGNVVTVLVSTLADLPDWLEPFALTALHLFSLNPFARAVLIGFQIYYYFDQHNISNLVNTDFTASQAWLAPRRDPLVLDLDGDGTDTILDTDHQGQIQYDGTILNGGKLTQTGGNTYRSTDGKFLYALISTPGSPDLLTVTDPGGNMLIQDFASGDLGINLNPADPLPPAQNIIVGDYIQPTTASAPPSPPKLSTASAATTSSPAAPVRAAPSPRLPSTAAPATILFTANGSTPANTTASAPPPSKSNMAPKSPSPAPVRRCTARPASTRSSAA